MDLVTAARGWLGVKFMHQGRSRLGVDCGGLLVLAAADIGKMIEDVKGYSRMPDGVTLKASLDKQFISVPKSDMKPGDILLIAFRKEPQHVAIKTDMGLIHSHENSGGVVEHNLDQQWRNMIRGVYRFG